MRRGAICSNLNSDATMLQLLADRRAARAGGWLAEDDAETEARKLKPRKRGGEAANREATPARDG